LAVDREKLVRIIRNCSPRVSPASSLPLPSLPPEWEPLVFSPERPAAGSGAAVPSVSASAGCPAAGKGEKIRVVLFDIYGTLFCSAAGDISIAGGGAGEPGGEGRNRLEALVREFAPGFSAEDMADYFRRRVLEIHRERAGTSRYPEVRVENIWAGFLERFSPKEEEAARKERAREFALRYELAVNPVFPLPGAAGVIAFLRKSGFLLGLISNAQFFTPLLFDAFLGASPENLGFDPALIIYSCEMEEAKPSPALFGRAAEELARRGIDSGACLYIGNDMRNDILGAAAEGWKTVLFAGDPLSLRPRRGDPSVGSLKPWRIIRDLRHLAALLSPASPEDSASAHPLPILI
jgi:putative hydrolase of the HAD superfamily